VTNSLAGEVNLAYAGAVLGSHLYRMFPKLGISSRGELLRLAAERARAQVSFDGSPAPPA
jgi:hypothetical protein